MFRICQPLSRKDHRAAGSKKGGDDYERIEHIEAVFRFALRAAVDGGALKSTDAAGWLVGEGECGR
jgi:hypothetical protein